MTKEEKYQLLKEVELKNYLEVMLKQEAFQIVFQNHYLKETLNEMIYREGASPGVMVELNARKAFSDYLYMITDRGIEAEKKLKGN